MSLDVIGLTPDQLTVWNTVKQQFVVNANELISSLQSSSQLLAVSAVSVITPSATRLPTDPWIITEPGSYRLSKTFHFEATQGNLSAIVIDADDVTLDLCGNCVVADNRLGLQRGLVILPHRNVTVKNGTIRDFTLNGVLVIVCDTVHLTRLNIKHTGDAVNFLSTNTAAGIYVLVSNNVSVDKCAISDTVSAAGNNAGLFALVCSNLTITKCVSKNNVNYGGPVSGFQGIACSDVLVSRSSTSNNSTKSGNLTAASHTVGGFYFVASSRLTIVKCCSKNLFGECDDCHGFPIFLCPGPVTITKCSAKHIRSGFNKTTGTGAKATGFEIDGTSLATLTDCRASCVMAYNPEDKQCAGFSTGLSRQVSFVNCVSTNNKCVGDRNNGALAMGFGWAPDPRPAFIGRSFTTTYQNCKASGNDIGFNLFNQQNSVMCHCESMDNRKYGVYNGPAVTISCHPCTECDPPLVTTIPNQGALNVVTCNKICDNKCGNIVDVQTNSTNVYTKNQICC